MSTYGPTDAGFVMPAESELRAEIDADQRTNVHPNLDLSAAAPQGQINGSFTRKLHEAWQAMNEADQARDPATAEDESLDAIGAYTGTPRLQAAPSTVPVRLTLNAGQSAPAGTLFSNGTSDVLWELDALTTNPGGAPADIDGTATCTQDGPTFAIAGTITTIETTVPGLTAVTNPSDAIVGRLKESDADYDRRRRESIELSGEGTLPALADNVRTIPGVIDAKARENTGDTTDANGIPPKSFEIIIDGGDDQEIANKILAEDTAGIRAYGTTEVSAVDSEGNTEIVGFSRPTEVSAYVVIEVESFDPAIWLDFEALKVAIQVKVAANFQTKGEPGYVAMAESAYPGAIAAAGMAVNGVNSVVANIGNTPLSGINYTATNTPLVAGPRDKITLQSENIVVVPK